MTEADIPIPPPPPRLLAQFEQAGSIAAVIEAAPNATVEEARQDLASLMGLATQVNALLSELGEAAAAPELPQLERTDIQMEAVLRFIANAGFGKGGGPVHLPLLALAVAVSDRLCCSIRHPVQEESLGSKRHG